MPPGSDPHSPRRKPPFFLLVLVTISGTLAIHMVVPALPAAANGLHVEAAQLQLAISVYAFGLAAGQLVYGPLSDARGRRPVLLTGLVLYAIGGTVATFALNVPMLLAARFVQAIGGCAGLALGRAMVRDTSTADGAIGQLASLNLVTMLGPALAPMIGGALAGAFGWRYVFGALALGGVLTLLFAWRSIPETTTPSGRVEIRGMVTDSARLLALPQFTGFAFGGGVLLTAAWGFLTAAPFILTRQLGEPVQAVGLYSGVIVLGAGAGNAVTRRLVSRVDGHRLILLGTSICLIGGLCLLALVLSHRLGTYPLVASLLIFTCGTGMVNPVVVTRAISVRPQLTGSAAGLFGFLQMVLGGVITMLVTLGNDPSLAAALLLVGAALVAGASFLVAIRSDRVAYTTPRSRKSAIDSAP